MPASMISAPTGGKPKVMGSSIATVAMVPMPGSTPTSVPTSAPIRHSRRLTGVRATPKPRDRLEKSSNIPPSLHQETREELQRQPQRIREEQAAADRQANSDDDGFPPPRFRSTERRYHEAGKCRDHQAQRADGNGEGKDGERDEQRTAPGIMRQMRAFADQADNHYGEAQSEQQTGKHPRCGTGSKGKSMHALQIARRPQGEDCDRHQRYPADKVLRAADPFRHDGIAPLKV